jgi:hypothetical protein
VIVIPLNSAIFPPRDCWVIASEARSSSPVLREPGR